MEMVAGLEPAIYSFADYRLTIWPHLKLAEEVGLEPTHAKAPNGLANRPLYHLGTLPITIKNWRRR